jgi:hypothetical protein
MGLPMRRRPLNARQAVASASSILALRFFGQTAHKHLMAKVKTNSNNDNKNEESECHEKVSY